MAKSELFVILFSTADHLLQLSRTTCSICHPTSLSMDLYVFESIHATPSGARRLSSCACPFPEYMVPNTTCSFILLFFGPFLSVLSCVSSVRTIFTSSQNWHFTMLTNASPARLSPTVLVRFNGPFKHLQHLSNCSLKRI